MMIDDDDDDEYCLTIVNIEQQYALSPLVEVIFTLRNKRNSDENLSKGKRELPLFEKISIVCFVWREANNYRVEPSNSVGETRSFLHLTFG